jgi:hypothetical protein
VRSRLQFGILVASFMLFSGSVFAASDAESEKAMTKAPAKEMAKDSKDKKICKRVEDTGSFTGRRVCQTQKEWDAVLKKP